LFTVGVMALALTDEYSGVVGGAVCEQVLLTTVLTVPGQMTCSDGGYPSTFYMTPAVQLLTDLFVNHAVHFS